MTQPLWINRGQPYWESINTAVVEQKYKATYLGDFCLDICFGKPGGPVWSERAYAVFYEENPRPEHSHYFGLHVCDGRVWIVGAASVAEGHWDGMVANDGEIIFSRWRHDYRESTDGSVFVDGGRDYFKRGGRIDNPCVRITVVRDQLVVNDSLILPYAPQKSG